MDNLLFVFSFVQKFLVSIGPFVILLGILIFIHELGHFLFARFFGVEVKVFSLGFGPKILKYKKGPTVYCVSLLPLGGYVKMFGDNPLETLTESEKSKAFLYKKSHQKWLIAFAGPFFNLLFTLLVFFGLAWYGISSLPAQLGDIDRDSPAYQEGFRSGDRILFINNKPIAYFEELSSTIQTSLGQNLFFKVQEESGQVKEINSTVKPIAKAHFLDSSKNQGNIEGLSPFSYGLKLGVIPQSLAYKKGLRSFDILLEVNGEKLRYWRQLESLEFKNLKAQRGETELKVFLEEPVSLKALGLEPSFLYIEKVGPDTPALKAGLKKGDRLLSIEGQTLEKWEQVLEAVEKSKAEALKLAYQRGKEIKTAVIQPKPLFVEGNIKERYMLGIGSGAVSVLPPELLRKRTFFESIAYSFLETKQWLSITVKGIFYLIKGKISIRTMGGPIAIGRLASNSFSRGFTDFLVIMAVISINLFILNLLPIPALDGGHLLFFSLEALLRRPLSVKKLLIAQNLGLFFLLAFIIFTVVNDIYNWLTAW